MTAVYLGLGSNIQPEHYIELGIHKLNEMFDVRAVSPWYRSQSQGFDGPNFINLVVEIEYEGELQTLAAAIKQLEYECGREAGAVKFSSRTLDIDILLFGGAVGKIAGIELPRTDIYQYAYVLKPLLDIFPEGRDPKTGRLFSDYLPSVAQQWLEPIAH